MITYSAGSKPVVRLEVLVRAGVEPRIERTGNDELTLFVAANGNTDGGSAAAPSPITAAPSVTPISAKSSDTKLTMPSSMQAIESVKLGQNGEQTEVNVVGSGKLSYHVIRLQNPDRLVLDFSGAHLKTSEKNIASNLDPVREIRLAQFSPEVSRVVIDLRSPARYNINSTGNAVTVAFTPAAASAPAPATDQPSNITTTKSEIPAAIPAPAATSAPVVVAKQITPAPVTPAVAGTVPAPVAALPAALTGSSSALATPAAVTTPAAPAPAVAVPQQPAPAGRYSGEPISVNLKDVDLRDFFRLIHEISGLNVVVDPAVNGNLTIVLDDVPWDQALDIVLHNNDLDKQVDGNVLRIATKDTLKKEAEQNRELAKAQAEAADVVTTTRVLSYAKATDLVPTMKKFLSSRGDVLADDRSNTLIIRDIPSVLPVMDNLIRQLDRKSQQVEIEARVVAANRSFSREIGTQFGVAGVAAGNNQHLRRHIAGRHQPDHRNSRRFRRSSCRRHVDSRRAARFRCLRTCAAATPTSGLTYAFCLGQLRAGLPSSPRRKSAASASCSPSRK